MSDETTIDTIVFLVSLDTSTMPPVLKVTGDKYVKKSQNKQLIHWKLDDELKKKAEFVEQTECRPGFEWLSWPPPIAAVFDKAIRASKDKVSINDTHSSADSDGRWYYKLRVSLDGQVYETPMTAPDPVDVDDPCNSSRMLASSNPIIINN